MPDPIMYQEDGYVVLETNQPETFYSAAELLEKLRDVLARHQDELPHDLQKFDSIDEQAKALMENSCEFDLGPGEYLQWYAVRLEK